MMAYTTDLTVPQFDLLEHFYRKAGLSKASFRGTELSMRFFINSKTAVSGARLPADFPNWQSVYRQFSGGSSTERGKKFWRRWQWRSAKQ